MNSIRMLVFVLAAWTIRLSTSCCAQEPLPESSKTNRVRIEESDVNTTLNHFCARASLPTCGINIRSMSEYPETSAWFFLHVSTMDDVLTEEFRNLIGLSEVQVDKINSLRSSDGLLPRDHDSAFEVLTNEQQRMVRLSGLLMDGAPALCDAYFASEIGLSDLQILQLRKEVASRRLNLALPRHQESFGGGGKLPPFVSWKETTESVELNQWIVERLNNSQKDKLARIFNAAEVEGKELRNAYLNYMHAITGN